MIKHKKSATPLTLSIILFICIMSSLLCGCAIAGKKSFWGWGSVEYYPDGTLKKIQSDPPTKDIISLQMLKT